MADESAHKVFTEKERIGKLSQIRELVFGAQDGLLVPLGVITSVAGAFNNNHIVIIAGISEGLAGAFSMGTGAYLASQAELQVHKAEIDQEHRSIEQDKRNEFHEMRLLLEKEGVHKEDAHKITNLLAKYEKSFKTTMIQKELGLEPNPAGTPIGDALLVGLSYAVSAIIPLAPYFFVSGKLAITLSIAATLVALFVIGVLKGRVAMLPYVKSGFQVMLVGAGSGFGGYFLGTFLPKFFHLE